MMSTSKSFKGTIQESDRGGAYVTVPFDVEREFGSKRPKVRATIDGEVYRGTLVRMGEPRHLLIIRKDIRHKIAKQPGDSVQITVALDTQPRVVHVPADLARKLDANRVARKFFDSLSYTNRKEYVAWIEGAKREATRLSRIDRAVTMLANGCKAP